MKTELIQKLEALLKEYNAELSGAYDGDVNLYIENCFAGYWCGDVTVENFQGID